MAAIYPHAICTFRIVTRNEKNSVSILFSLLRVGQGAMQVDNASSGGLYMQVDAVTGQIRCPGLRFRRSGP
ncbi:MAG: sugar-transfer associated ATP-grasp domain-containing protein [Alistipes indistinctus]